MEKFCNTDTSICQENSLHHIFFSFSLLCLAPRYSSKWPFVTLVLSSSYHYFSSASFTFLSLLPCCPHTFCSLPPQFMPVDGGIQQVLGVPASLPLSLLSVQLGSRESCSCARVCLCLGDCHSSDLHEQEAQVLLNYSLFSCLLSQ